MAYGGPVAELVLDKMQCQGFSGECCVVCAQQEEEYLKAATGFYDKLTSWKADNYAYDWDNKSPALHVLFSQVSAPGMEK